MAARRESALDAPFAPPGAAGSEAKLEVLNG